MEEDLMEQALKAHKRSYKKAFETAVRTNTALVFYRDGKIVTVKPPYRYELVPIKQKKEKKLQRLKRNKLFLEIDRWGTICPPP